MDLVSHAHWFVTVGVIVASSSSYSRCATCFLSPFRQIYTIPTSITTQRPTWRGSAYQLITLWRSFYYKFVNVKLIQFTQYPLQPPMFVLVSLQRMSTETENEFFKFNGKAYGTQTNKLWSSLSQPSPSWCTSHRRQIFRPARQSHYEWH